VRAGERLDMRELVHDAPEDRERRRVDGVEFGARRLARQTNVGERDGVAVGVAAGRWVGQMRLDRDQGGRVPVPAPFRHPGLVEPDFPGKVFTNARHDQRVRIGGDELRKRAHARAAARITRQQRRSGMRLVQIFDDRQRLEQRRPFAVDEHRYRHHRIDRAERRRTLLAFHQVYVHHLIGHEAFEVERDAHAVGRQRSPEGEEFHRHLVCPPPLVGGV
jgi:hypothetical protein